MNNIWILADTVEDAGKELESTPVNQTPVKDIETEAVKSIDGSTPPAEEDAPPPLPIWKNPQIIMLGVMFIIMYFLLIKGPKKKQQKHTQMVKAIQKNARIQTIGGIIGTVINVKENEIVIKIDESNNTKMTISKGAVSKVLSDDIN
ncbi:MAG: preprotein translocase subunit YajC [Phycisphaerae bacterium]|nr:preprotein translocase subunit YajC [Phycisphaerae bacterium]